MTELYESALQVLREGINKSDYTVSGEKSQFGGFVPVVTKKDDGTTLYSGQDMWKTADVAKKQAQAYLDAYANGGDYLATKRMKGFRADNASQKYER